MKNVALCHERTYEQPARRSKAERVAGTHLPLPLAPVDRRCGPGMVGFPKRRSRQLVRVTDIDGLAEALVAYMKREWVRPGCRPCELPEVVEVCNYLRLPMKDATGPGDDHAIVHASEDFYRHPWHDSVLTGGWRLRAGGNPNRPRDYRWVKSVWMCRCHTALLFPVPRDCTDDKLLESAVYLGKKHGHCIPLLLVTQMCQFWPWRNPQNAAALPKWLTDQGRLPAYTDSKAMRDCGDFLRKYTRVKVWHRVDCATFQFFPQSTFPVGTACTVL